MFDEDMIATRKRELFAESKERAKAWRESRRPTVFRQKQVLKSFFEDAPAVERETTKFEGVRRFTYHELNRMDEDADNARFLARLGKGKRG